MVQLCIQRRVDLAGRPASVMLRDGQHEVHVLVDVNVENRIDFEELKAVAALLTAKIARMN